MSNKPRISLIDPILYQSSYINRNVKPPVEINFWKRFNLLNFIFNILLPIAIIVFVLFVLKDRYITKLQYKRADYNKHQINFS